MESGCLHTVDLAVGYQKLLFKNLSLTLESGTITCLIGRNGAGKSTLIRTLAKIQKKLGGKVYLKGVDMDVLTEKEVSRLLSVVLTHPVNVPFMTVFDLVAFGRYPYLGGQIKMGFQDEQIINDAIRSVGIEALSKRYLLNLSDGERQKAALARSLAQKTPFILLDEPAAFLDFPSKIELVRLLHGLSKQSSKAILLSTHDIEMAVALADQLWLIDQNRNIVTGKPVELLKGNIIPDTFNIPSSFFDTAKERYGF